VEEFLDSLTGKQAQKVVWVLRLIRDRERVSSRYLKKLVDTREIWEVRVQHGRTNFRILGFFGETGELVLTNGFGKKRDRVPRREIGRADNRRSEYLERSRNDG